MSERWYKVRRFNLVPISVNVIKETPQTVTIDDGNGPYKAKKASDGERYVKTWGEARSLIIARTSAQVLEARRKLARAQVDADRALQLPLTAP